MFLSAPSGATVGASPGLRVATTQSPRGAVVFGGEIWFARDFYMRFTYLLALVVSLSIGATYWYESTKHLCPIPVSYRLGEIDESFSITRAEAFAAIDQAIAVWEDELPRDLFVYDEEPDLEIAFIFDDRQQLADDQQVDQARLDQMATQNATISRSIERLQQNYDTREATFLDQQATYESQLQEYEAAVRQANDRGGATEQEFTRLEADRLSLENVSASLRAEAAAIDELATELNELSAEGNRLVRLYNEEVLVYNAAYGTGEQFTQGDYTGDAINIYKFTNESELVSVLAHEFGHALGIGHVENPDALMYYLLEAEGGQVRTLSDDDRAAYDEVCQPDTWQFAVRQFIRSILS